MKVTLADHDPSPCCWLWQSAEFCDDEQSASGIGNRAPMNFRGIEARFSGLASPRVLAAF
jgi:hypothetical protein